MAFREKVGWFREAGRLGANLYSHAASISCYDTACHEHVSACLLTNIDQQLCDPHHIILCCHEGILILGRGISMMRQLDRDDAFLASTELAAALEAYGSELSHPAGKVLFERGE